MNTACKQQIDHRFQCFRHIAFIPVFLSDRITDFDRIHIAVCAIALQDIADDFTAFLQHDGQNVFSCLPEGLDHLFKAEILKVLHVIGDVVFQNFFVVIDVVKDGLCVPFFKKTQQQMIRFDPDVFIKLFHIFIIYNLFMKKNRIRKLEIVIGVLFLVFALMIVIGGLIRNNKEEPATEEPAEEKGPQIDYSKIESISGKYYYEDENFTSSFGIDVSEFQDEIDWKKVKEDSVEFAYIRIGRRGATTGLLYEDEKFLQNYNGARENGILTGVYFFSQAKDEKEALEEAEWVKEHLKDKKVDLPIVYDCEEVFLEDEESRLTGIDKVQLTANTIAFLEEMKKSGYEVMVYTYQYWADTYYEMDKIAAYPIWFAQYDTDSPKLEYPIRIWQYSNQGTISGIKEPTDLNIMFIQKNDQPE